MEASKEALLCELRVRGADPVRTSMPKGVYMGKTLETGIKRGLSRQDFLRLSGAGLAGATLLGTAACGGARSEGGGGGGGSEGKSFNIKLAHVTTAETPKGMASERFKQEVEERSEGRITVEVFPNSTLYGDEDELQALQSGGVQMIAPASAKLTDIAPQLFVLDLPFLFDSVDEVPEVISRDSTVGQSIYDNQELASSNMRVMGLWDNGLMQMTSNSAIRTPDDIQGLRMRITPSDIIRTYWETWGAETTVMAFAEVFTGLQQGVIDGQYNPYSNIESQQFYEVQDYLTVANQAYLAYTLVMNDEFFNSLPEDLQQVVTESADAATAYNREIAFEVNREARQVIVDAGTTEFIELTPEERQAFKDEVVPAVWNEYADVIGQDIIDELLAMDQQASS